MIKKADIFLGIFLILLCLGSVFFLHTFQDDGAYVQITVDGELYGTYSLDEDRQIHVSQTWKDGSDHSNTVQIRDGLVFMEEADCHNQLCVEQGAISRTNQTVVCLPNRVVVSIQGKDSGIDAVSY